MPSPGALSSSKVPPFANCPFSCSGATYLGVPTSNLPVKLISADRKRTVARTEIANALSVEAAEDVRRPQVALDDARFAPVPGPPANSHDPILTPAQRRSVGALRA